MVSMTMCLHCRVVLFLAWINVKPLCLHHCGKGKAEFTLLDIQVEQLVRSTALFQRLNGGFGRWLLHRSDVKPARAPDGRVKWVRPTHQCWRLWSTCQNSHSLLKDEECWSHSRHSFPDCLCPETQLIAANVSPIQDNSLILHTVKWLKRKHLLMWKSRKYLINYGFYCFFSTAVCWVTMEHFPSLVLFLCQGWG